MRAILSLALVILLLLPGSGVAAITYAAFKARKGNTAEAERNLKARAAFLALTKEEQLETILGAKRPAIVPEPERLM